MDEGNTSSGAFLTQSQGAPAHAYLTQPGGAIGLGLPCATGAAIACPERPVINIQADGSAMYTLQALWTQARESLNVTTIICANRSYRILGVELMRAGVKEFGPVAQQHDLARPTATRLDTVGARDGRAGHARDDGGRIGVATRTRVGRSRAAFDRRLCCRGAKAVP
jgi:thiamine pyrophosphate-dependent acetolactate synthase large subunit-like protein